MMQEEIIPPLKTALEAEEDVSQVELSFQNNPVRAVVHTHTTVIA